MSLDSVHVHIKHQNWGKKCDLHAFDHGIVAGVRQAGPSISIFHIFWIFFFYHNSLSCFHRTVQKITQKHLQWSNLGPVSAWFYALCFRNLICLMHNCMSVQVFLIKWSVSVYTLLYAKHLCTFITTVNNDTNDLASKHYKF